MSLLKIKGRVWKFGDNISTDLLMPNIAESHHGYTYEQKAKYVMYANRPGWVNEVKKGDIIVGKNNFGCGSSRPAAGSVKALGISCILAESVSRIFFRNSISLGLPVFEVPGIYNFCNEGDVLEIKPDLGEVKNLTTCKTLLLNLMSEESPPMQILKAGGLEQVLKKELHLS